MINLPRFWRRQNPYYRLMGETCRTCGKAIFPPRDVCPYCGQLEQGTRNNAHPALQANNEAWPALRGNGESPSPACTHQPTDTRVLHLADSSAVGSTKCRFNPRDSGSSPRA